MSKAMEQVDVLLDKVCSTRLCLKLEASLAEHVESSEAFIASFEAQPSILMEQTLVKDLSRSDFRVIEVDGSELGGELQRSDREALLRRRLANLTGQSSVLVLMANQAIFADFFHVIGTEFPMIDDIGPFPATTLVPATYVIDLQKSELRASTQCNLRLDISERTSNRGISLANIACDVIVSSKSRVVDFRCRTQAVFTNERTRDDLKRVIRAQLAELAPQHASDTSSFLSRTCAPILSHASDCCFFAPDPGTYSPRPRQTLINT